MFKNTNIEVFLEQLAQDVETEKYNKATFPKALVEGEWTQLIADLLKEDSAINERWIAPFQFIGILPLKPRGTGITCTDLASSLAQRLELVKFAKENIKDFTAVRH